jgi:predicted nucleic acid-binding Zn ribbon protein
MPVYDYQHLESPGADCRPVFEHSHGINERLACCPICGVPVKKVVSRFSHHVDPLVTSNIKEKGFRRFRRRDKGVYEED